MMVGWQMLWDKNKNKKQTHNGVHLQVDRQSIGLDRDQGQQGGFLLDFGLVVSTGCSLPDNEDGAILCNGCGVESRKRTI